MKKVTKFLALCVAVLLAFGGTLPVAAANYTAIPGTTTQLTKYLVVDNDAEIPDAEFEFTVTAGNSVEATAETVKVWAGVNPEAVKVNGTAETGVVNFTAGEATTAGTATDGIANSADKKYASKTIELDFSEVEFAEPGVYRYVITEKDPVSPISAVDSPITTVDVYVVDNAGKLEVQGYVAYEGTVTDAPKVATADNATAPNNGAEAGEKDAKFVNELATANLKVKKTVTGNSGSRDQYFEFTITVNNAGADTVMTLDMSGAETSTHENTATSFTKEAMDEANQKDDDASNEGKAGQQVIADANGSATFKVYLHHGQEAVLKGLPVGATYTVSETAAAGYETKYNVKVGSADAVEKQDVTNDEIGAEDVEVDTVNHRNGVIPTGLFVSVGTPLAIGAVAVGLFLAKRKKEDEE